MHFQLAHLHNLIAYVCLTDRRWFFCRDEELQSQQAAPPSACLSRPGSPLPRMLCSLTPGGQRRPFEAGSTQNRRNDILLMSRCYYSKARLGFFNSLTFDPYPEAESDDDPPGQVVIKSRGLEPFLSKGFRDQFTPDHKNTCSTH